MVGHCTCAKYPVHTMPFLQGLTGVIHRPLACSHTGPEVRTRAWRARLGGGGRLGLQAIRMVGSLQALGSRTLTREPLGFLTGISGQSGPTAAPGKASTTWSWEIVDLRLAWRSSLVSITRDLWGGPVGWNWLHSPLQWGMVSVYQGEAGLTHPLHGQRVGAP